VFQALYIRENGLAGAMLWAMCNDDFNNHCGYGAWPLLTTIKNLLPDNK
jgi:GH18 family chitinase